MNKVPMPVKWQSNDFAKRTMNWVIFGNVQGNLDMSKKHRKQDESFLKDKELLLEANRLTAHND